MFFFNFDVLFSKQALYLNNTSPFRTISITDDEELGTGATFRLCITVFDANEPLRVTMVRK